MSFAGSAERIWQATIALGQPRLAGFSVEILPEIDSTNSELMRRARAGRTEPTLLVAEQQSAGRGRMGRTWHAAPGQGLTFSIGLPLAPVAWDGLSLAVGVSLAGSLHADIQLKWPNDLWWHGHKLGGVLIETVGMAAAQRYAVLGVGLNIAMPAGVSDALGTSDAVALTALQAFTTPAAGLQQLVPSTTAAQALEAVTAPLLADLLQFEREGFVPFASRFAARDALLAQAVRCSDGVEGVVQGVDATGALLVRTMAGVQRVHSGEVSVRPVSS
jgi:BirA family transcriptional regulator, biotin operon repressor / biotin---[acetyl-CoA-carboxylase] ligase